MYARRWLVVHSPRPECAAGTVQGGDAYGSHAFHRAHSTDDRFSPQLLASYEAAQA